jgi:hypothetical protein
MTILEQRYLPITGIEAEDTGHEVLVYLAGGDKTLYLNDTAAIVWRLCNGEQTGNDMIAMLVEAYPEAAQAIPTEVADTLQSFIDKGLIQVHG